MTRKTFFVWGLALCLLLGWSGAAPAADVAALADKVQKHYKSLNSFSADFTQVLKNATSKAQETRSGRIFFAQPALLRWETQKPEQELLVVGKEGVWNVFEDERTAYRYPVEEVLGSKTMLRFVSGTGNLKEDFSIQELSDAPKGQIKLKLTPREAEPAMVLAHLWVDASTLLITRVEVEDFYGNVNDVTLSAFKPNPSLAKDLFQYAPPAGYQTFDNTGATKGKVLTK